MKRGRSTPGKGANAEEGRRDCTTAESSGGGEGEDERERVPWGKTSERKSRDRWLGAMGERETLVEMDGHGGAPGFGGDVWVTVGDVNDTKIPLF
jgi:hypothetical protein